ncbi:MAG TPA: pyrroline-5-carboxylate reductase [Polyangiaceae bacterium]|nr:pyrroline-5-carboxylate reductase [Polyangiaceae bacterium]
MSHLASTAETLAFLGAGNMAAALARSLVRAGYAPSRIVLSDLDASKCAVLASELGVRVAPTTAEAVEQADVVFVAVKPAGVVPLLGDLAPRFGGKLLISVAAGVTTERLEGALGSGARVVRCMPNTPALVGAGATALCRGRHAGAEDLALAERLLGAGGLTALVDESMMDAVTGLSGSGPAFVMLVIEALADGGVRAGLPRAIAHRLAAQTVLGSAQLVLETGKHPGELKDSVTSPGGTTIAGIEALEQGGLRGTLMAAVRAAAERSRELSKA